MAEKVAKLGIKRDDETFIYYVKNGDLWQSPRKRPGEPPGRARRIADCGVEMDLSTFIYYLDEDGDISATKREVKKRATKAKATKQRPTKAKKTTSEQNARELLEEIASRIREFLKKS